MEIVIAIIIGIVIVFIMMNFRNRKKMDEIDGLFERNAGEGKKKKKSS